MFIKLFTLILLGKNTETKKYVCCFETNRKIYVKKVFLRKRNNNNNKQRYAYSLSVQKKPRKIWNYCLITVNRNKGEKERGVIDLTIDIITTIFPSSKVHWIRSLGTVWVFIGKKHKLGPKKAHYTYCMNKSLLPFSSYPFL